MKLLDLFCGAGGAAMGYYHAGFHEIVGVDIKPQPHYPFQFVQADALEYLAEHGKEFDVVHASPPCQGYSVMNNLPWLKGREYPLLILPTLEMLEALGKPYVLENVMGARYGAKGLTKRGLEAHGLQAGWLCGQMFGLPFYRHRLFATNWFWLQPGHPKHQQRIRPRHALAGRTRDIVFPDGTKQSISCGALMAWQGNGAQAVPQGNFDKWRASGDPMAALMGKMATLGKWQNGTQPAGVGVGHAKGWRLAAEAMGIDWCNRAELTQAIPPAYTKYIGERLWLETVLVMKREREEECTMQKHEYGCPDCHVPMLRSRTIGSQGWHCNRCDRDFEVRDGLLYARGTVPDTGRGTTG